MGELRYSSMYSEPRHWMEVSGQLHDQIAFPPGKESPAPIRQEAGWATWPV